MQFLDHVNLLLAQEDIEGLICMGAPYDEYSNEAKMIVDKMIGKVDISQDQVSDIVADVFDSQFCFSASCGQRMTAPYHFDLTRDLSKKIWLIFLEHIGVQC